MSEYYSYLLGDLLNSPNSQISTLDFMPRSDLNRFLDSVTGSGTDYASENLVHQLIEKQVAERPGDPVSIYEGNVMTYDQLNQSANKLAHLIERLRT